MSGPSDPQGFEEDPTIFDEGRIEDFELEDEAEAAGLDAVAEAEVEAGQWVSGEAVARWVRSLGSAEPLPRPKCGA